MYLVYHGILPVVESVKAQIRVPKLLVIGTETIITEPTSVSSHLGELALKEVKLPGTLRLTFSNAASWLSTRTVQYRFAPVDLEVSEEA